MAKKKKGFNLAENNPGPGFKLQTKGANQWTLRSADGTEYGKVSYKAYEAAQKGTLGSYTPASSEKETIEKFKKNSKVNLASPSGTGYESISYGAYEAIQNFKLDDYLSKATEDEKKVLENFKKNTKVDFLGADGKSLGKISYEGYEYITSKGFDGYTAKNSEESNTIAAVKKQRSIPLVIEVDGKKKDFGKINYYELKYLNGEYGYTSLNDGEKGKALKDFEKYVAEQAKKEREPENWWKGILHGVGYTLEKVGAGVVGGLEDAGNFIGAAGATLLTGLTPEGTVRDDLKKFAKGRFEYKTIGDMWEESAESRYRVPDWYRENFGVAASNLGNMIPAMAAEIYTGGVAPTMDTLLAKSLYSSATKAGVSSVTKSLSTKLITPKPSDAMFFLSAAGSSAKAGYAKTGNLGQSLNYGVLNGIGEVATEKLFGGFGGTGIGADELIDLSKIKGVSKLASTKYGKKVLDIALEGVEETIMVDLEPWFRKATIDPNAKISNLTELQFWKERGEAFKGGVMLSVFSNAATYTGGKAIGTISNAKQRIQAVNTLNKSAENLNGLLPSESQFEPLKYTASVEQIEKRNSEINRVKKIGVVNIASDSINAILKNDGDKLVPLKHDSTEAEILQRQKEIDVFSRAYADLMVDELTKNNPEIFAGIEKISVGDQFIDTKTGYAVTVVDRDAKNTTVEINTGKTTATKVFSNNQADNFATNGQLVEVENESADTVVPAPESPTPVVTTENAPDTSKGHTVAYTNDNQKIDLAFKVVSVDELVASNELDGRVNPNYPQELQPRDRSRVSSKSQISQMAKSLNPARLAESTSVSEGAPIVGSDNVVESGNGRTLAIKLAYQLGSAENYRNYIISNAAKYGIDVSNLPEHPVLVRERMTEVDRTDFTRKANESSIGSLSATEQARVDAEKLTDDVLGLLVANDDGIINTNDNKEFISAVITKVFNNEDLNNVVNAEGKLSTRGLERITNAIFYKAYGDASLSSRLSESLDNDMKNATKVLLNVAPKVVVIKNGIASGNMYNFDFSEDIANAVRLFEKCRNESLTIEDYAAQTTIFEKESPVIMSMAYVFETKNRGAKQATDFYNLLLDTVVGMGDPDQISLDIIEPFQTKEEILDEAIARFNRGEESKNTIAIPKGVYESASTEGREDDGRGIDEVSRNELSETEKIEDAIGIQQDNGHVEETRIVEDDEQLRQKNESVEGKSEVTEEAVEEERNKIREKAKKTGKINLDEFGTLTGIPVTHMSDTTEATVSEETSNGDISETVETVSKTETTTEKSPVVEETDTTVRSYVSGNNGTKDGAIIDEIGTDSVVKAIERDKSDVAIATNSDIASQTIEMDKPVEIVYVPNGKGKGTYAMYFAQTKDSRGGHIASVKSVGGNAGFDGIYDMEFVNETGFMESVNGGEDVSTTKLTQNNFDGNPEVVKQIVNDILENKGQVTFTMDDVDINNFNEISCALFSEVSKYLPDSVKAKLGFKSQSFGSIPRYVRLAGVNSSVNTGKAINIDHFDTAKGKHVDEITKQMNGVQSDGVRNSIETSGKTKNEESAKNDEPKSEVLARESGTDDRGLRSKSSETVEQEAVERVDGQLREDSRETLSQSNGTDGNKSDVGNDSEGIHRGNDADVSNTETTSNTAEIADSKPETIETEDKSIEKKRPSNKENFVITDDVAREFDNTHPNAKDNIEAIELLLKLENEGRPATAEEKKILSKYKGWGGIDIRNLPWELSRKLYDLYDGPQLRDMQSSQNNAFFTPTGVVDAMYKGLKRMGFKGGNVLESSMGIGNFFGRMPAAMTAKSALTGVELESYTARIAQYLYPGATVINKPFQDVAIRNGSYDLVIGNVPFGTNKISYNKKKYSLHNYFIISSLDKVKDGGVVAVITSSGTLDSYGIDARKAIMDRADVVACYKLPERVFSRNANTDTTTDLLILKKRASDAKPSGDSILNVTTTDDGLRLNEYFVKHPENVLGTLTKGTNAWGEITTVLDNGDFYGKLNEAMNNLPKDLISGKSELKPIETIVTTNSKPRFFEKNGKIYSDDGAGTATSITNASHEKTIRDYMEVRDAYKDLLAAYDNDMSETDIKPLRDKLTKAYDKFSEKHGAITGDGKKKIGKTKSKDNRFLSADADYYLVGGLEKYNKNDEKIEKSAVFEKDTLRKKKVTSVDVASDALAVSLNESGRIDFARMSELTGKTEKQLVEELKGEIVLTPEGDYVLTDIYLSGNIYEKIEKVKGKPEFKEQQEMLERVLPTPKDASSIMVKLGANYIDAKYIQDFSREVFNTRIEVSKNSSGTWLIEGVRQYRYGDILNVKYGCGAFNAIQLLEKVLNDSEITAKKTIKVDGKSVSVYDEKMTEVARQKAEDIKEAFENWIFRDSERRADVVEKYNRTYNNYRALDYERIAEKLSFDSMDETLKSKLYPHQKKGIARFLFGGNILFAHGVGTGKTFEMIASVMEAKRMGIVNKTAMVVPNNKVVDFKNDIAQAYPNAKVLVIDTADKKRQTMLGLVNSNDWDIVLIARTTFTKIPVGAELQSNFINQQLEELDRQILEAEQDRSISKRKLKGLYTQRDNLEQKLKDLDSDTKRDENSVEFEKLGFDCICVDEAHNYKSITTLTKLDIKGLASGSDAQQANDMLMKLDYMRSIDGRIIFGTGTPITNTVSEIYNMMRMVRPDILEDAGIHSLDEWVNTFAKIDTHTEIGVDNKVKNKATQTIRSFVNGTEMVGMFRQFADVVFTQDVVKNLPKAVPVVIELDGTEELRQIEAEISSTIASASGKEALSAYTKAMAMANAASIDLKMLSGAESDVNIFKDYSLEELEYENSKVNTMCNYVYDEYKASKDIKGTQIIFCDGGAGSGKIYSFNVHNDVKQKLIERGIPENEIVIVKNQKDAQLEELFDKVNSGEVRVLIGTSRKMAEGLNVQKRVVAIHHPTVTFKPSDLEQGDARGVRAGNINEEVKIYRYLQGNTFDSYKWQAIDRKGEMINRALRGESVDELEDIGADDDSDAGVDAATAMAITSGNPLVKEKIDIDKEVKRLKNLKQNYMNEHYRYEDAVAKNPGYIRQLTDFAQKLEQDIALRDKHGDKAVISINGKTFEKQADANKALIEAVKKAPKNGKFTKLGEYNGFDIMFKGDTGGMGYAMVVKGANEYSVEYTGSGNNIARIAGVLNRLTSEQEKVAGRLNRLKSDLEFAKQEVDKPFEKEKDLTEALEKQKDITYRYEHFGESKADEQTETSETESSETAHYSKRSVDADSDVAERWTTERVESAEKRRGKKDSTVNIGDIVNAIREKFDIPVATGKVTNPAASAEYRERAESIRTRIANNLPDIAHELGHHLDKKYGLSKLDSVKKLRKTVSEEFLEQYPAEERNGESVSEFVRKYLQNTNNAHRLCPDFYDDFVSTLSKDDLKAVNEIANSVNEYMSYSSDERYGAAITTSKKFAKENTSVKENLHELRQKWVDPYLYIKDAVDYVEEAKGQTLTGKGNAYILAINSLNSHSVSNFLLTEGFRDLNGNIVDGAKSFLECISMVGSKDMSLFDEYLVLKHSLEWIAPKEEDVTQKRVFGDETLEDVDKIEKRIATIENEHPEFKTAAENLYEYQNNVLKYYLIPTGAITEETLDTLNRKYPNYVPFYRAVGKDKSLSGKAKGTFVNQKSPIKRAKGSGELIISPLESIIKNTEKFVKVAVRNQVADVLGHYADTVDGFAKFIEPIAPDMIPHTININKIKDTFLDELTHISKSSEDYFAVSELFDEIFGDTVTDYSPTKNDGKKIVTVLRGGKQTYYQVHDDNLYKSIAELSPQQLDGLKAVDFVMNAMKLLITQNNPIFAATNLVRDFGTAYKLSPTNNPIEFTVGYLKALTDIITNSDDYKQYKAMGGGHSSELTANIENISKTLRKVAEKDMGKARRLVYAIFVNPVETAAMLNDKTESIARFAEFKRTLEAGGDLQEAIYNANDLTTNFRKQGAGTTAKVVNKLFLFNNAAIQGLDKTARTLGNKNVQQRNKTWAKWLLHALIMGILGYLYNKEVDEEGYKNLSSYKKNNFYNFAIGDGKFISLPKPRENALLDSVTERAIEYLGGNDDAFYDFGSYLGSQLLPPMIPDDFSSVEGVAHSWLGSTALGGLVDIGFNRDFKGTPIESKYDEYTPSNERYADSTSKIAYEAGQTKLARKLNLSPKKIDHLLSSYTGIIGQVNKALFPMNKERRDKTIGLRNKFVSDSNYSTDVLNKLYDNKDAAKLEWQYDNNINNAIEYEKNGIITSYISGMNKAIKALPEKEQRDGRKYLLKALNGWNYDTTTQQSNMISRLEGESISNDYIFEELPSSEFTWTVDKQKYSYQMTPQEYNEYITLYLKTIENARKQYGDNSLEGYAKAKEAAKDYMSKYKKGLKDKYLSKATKVE